ncbi:MAG: hypothetical protein SFX73_23920 [Kofleriaceae bacterium]|nr:hypothetical protein [Kofleriaceae bacterium]
MRALHQGAGIMHRLFASILVASLASAGCASDADKGAEDDVLTDGKDDSFYSPTDHGKLGFGVPSQAAVTDGEGFHSWTFELTANASVELLTVESTGDLDTVMYLYKRASASGSWGSYIKKNDDANSDTSDSKLKGTLGKGQYRVVIKGHKRVQRGSFALSGACTGDGCPAAEVCAEPADLPSSTSYGGQCGPSLANIFANATVDTTTSFSMDISERCTAPALQRKAMDYYVSYFTDLAGELEYTELEVETRVLGGTGSEGGTLVDVTDGGDESGMTFVFDTSDKLVALYQHNQSPDVQFFCRGSGAAVELPNVEDCVSALIGDIVHDADDESDFNLTAAPNNLPVGLKGHIAKPMQRYAAARSTSASTKLTVTGATWDLYGGKAARIDVSATNKPVTAFLATSELVLIEAPSDGAAKLVCE